MTDQRDRFSSDDSSGVMSSPFGQHTIEPNRKEATLGAVRRTITLTRQWLLRQQQSDGHWVAELEGDTILESEFVLFLAYMGEEQSDLARAAADYLLEKQMPEGGWQMYPGGKIEISASVKAYFALKLVGHDPRAGHMQRARQAILAAGGADQVNSYTRFHLALLGQISYEQCPAVPPEVMLPPKWFPANLYAISSWSRTMVVPLSIIWAHRPVCKLDPSRGIRELFVKEPEDWPQLRCPGLPGGTGLFSWDRFFRVVDKTLKFCHRNHLTPWRKKAIGLAEQWMLAHFEGSDGLGAIFPPIVWSLIALKCLGYVEDSLEICECRRQIDDLIIQDPKTGSVRIQPCKSPVWDTAITVCALSEAGVHRDRPEMRRAVDWLLQKQISRPGDWSETVDVEPGGWAFEYNNDFYPDSDDTAMALMAIHTQFKDESDAARTLPPDLRLAAPRSADPHDQSQVTRMKGAAVAIQRGLDWMLAMQSSDGGWGAFDKDNNRQFLCYVPFADHNAMIDPSSPDLTGHVLDALGDLGRRFGSDAQVDRAVAYLRDSQEPNGSWFGRWGINYIYGTGEVLGGLAAVGVPNDDPAIVAGANWLLSVQRADGGWGESPDSYEPDGVAGECSSTASQTAWAVNGLLAAGLSSHPAVLEGIRFLTDSQLEDGSWDEPEFTGTGFPRVFYLRYHYYQIYFPLLSLSRWAVAISELPEEASVPALKVVGDES
jgi:squalene-hopene/tetraprenyl-beta-curcumene cyclase